MNESVLDRPVWHSLTGLHAHLGTRHGTAAVYDPEISPFAGTEGDGVEAWDDLRTLLAGRAGVLAGSPLPVADGIRVPFQVVGYQMIARDWVGHPDPDARELGPADHAEMLDLATRTKPGPFEKRTPEIGRYVGLRVDGKLVAMAGERLHPPGYTEISAVCTDEGFRGRGLAERAVRTVAAGIVARGETPILHVAGTNTGAIRLYERMGFVIRREIEFVGVVVPRR
ncbi:MAG: GNAT family N-acetyltransferase [Pseudolysinimonas sp.]|uniref:GNAT family N-acetyltransferase n=1 Tax=Pseudolysinimonas sp. TaxID=2680009 RepID=UPI00326601A5